jgi:pantoate--beta-alanine ligase
MILYKQSEDIRNKISQLKGQDKSIGFVPTMGALHEGHLSLIKQSLAETDITVVSIFINPTQFNDKKDFEKYPVVIENDIELLEKSGTDILFLPSVEEMYPNGLQAITTYDLSQIENILEGYYRPGHFQGVCNIMHRLLQTLSPDNLYMGQKDYQQCMIIQKLINDFMLPIKLNIVPTQREENGLAMSSRNMRLSAAAKQKAAAIYTAHLFIKNNLLKLPLAILLAQAKDQLHKAGFEKIDYIEVCDAFSLEPAKEYMKDQKLVVLTAAFIECVRLIDNLLLN